MHYAHPTLCHSLHEVLIRTVRRYWQILGKFEKKTMIGRWSGYDGFTPGSAALGAESHA